MNHDVFISHSSDDKPIGDAVCAVLETRGIKCWIAPRDILPGTDYGEAIIDAITQCRFMVLVLSTNANQSRQVIREVERAVNKDAIIIPFRVEDVTPSKSLEFFLSTPHWLDALTPPLERHIEYLAETILLLKSQEGQQGDFSSIAEQQSHKTSAPRQIQKQPAVEQNDSKPYSQTNIGGAVSDFTFKTLTREPEKLTGQRLGSYVIRKLVGMGGSGIVYNAFNPRLGRENCIKLFYPLIPGTENVAQIIQRGVRGVSALDHPDIVKIYDYSTIELADGVSFYLVMEFVQGTNLLDWAEEHSDLDVLLMASRIAGALEAAHQSRYSDEVGFEQYGVLHGDIKPANILIRANDSPVLLDFMMVDMQRLLDRTIAPSSDLDVNTLAFGTPDYMAPEQEAQGVVNIKTDIFSLGRTFYELFFPNNWRRVFNLDHQGVELERDEPLKKIRELLRRMTQDEASQRPRDMSEVCDALSDEVRKRSIAKSRVESYSRSEHADYVEQTSLSSGPPQPTTSTDFVDTLSDYTPGDEEAAEPPTVPRSVNTGALPAEYVAKPETPLIMDENVQFTVYRPKTILPTKWHSLLAFAHLSEKREDATKDEPDPIEEVRRQAQRMLGEQADDYQNLTQDTLQAIPREGTITFLPTMPGIEFNPPSRSFVWEESVHREDFRIRASVDVDGQVIKGRLSVFLGAILLADIPLSIRVDSNQAMSQSKISIDETRARPYRKIFASYSHKDKDIVEQFGSYVEAFGDRYLRDVTYLRSGEEWNNRLKKMIINADIFQLFWSTNSMYSNFVRQEWEYALSLHRPNFIRPTYWEEPFPAKPERDLPPEELMRLHFQRIFGGRVSHTPTTQPLPDIEPKISLSIEPRTSQSSPIDESGRDTDEFPSTGVDSRFETTVDQSLAREAPGVGSSGSGEIGGNYPELPCSSSTSSYAPQPSVFEPQATLPYRLENHTRSGGGGRRLDVGVSQTSNSKSSIAPLILLLGFLLLVLSGVMLYFLLK